jgi:hypothetical protein
VTNVDLDEALRRLNADIASAESALGTAQKRVIDAEQRLNDLLSKRKGAQVFLDYATQVDAEVPRTHRTASTGQGAIIEQIMRSNPGRLLSNTEVQAAAAEAGHDFDGEQVRNALSYMHRKGILAKGESRGTWVLPVAEQSEPTNDFGPASAAGPKEASDDADPNHGSVITGTFGASQPAR